MDRKHQLIHVVIVGAAAGSLLLAWGLEAVDFFKPWWLLLLLLLPYFTWQAVTGISGLPSRTNAISVTARGLLFILLTAALADIQHVRRSDALSVFFLMDYSASIPEHIREQELAYINAAVKTKRKNDLAGIVVFAEEPSIEYVPDKELSIDTIHSAVTPHYTNLQAAIELAVAASPANARKKIVLITDGNQNAGDVLEAVRYAAGEKVVVVLLPVSYDVRAEVLVDKVQLPSKVKENEPFELKVHVTALQAAPARLTILRNGQRVASEDVQLQKGRNHYVVPMKLSEPGFFTYTARISSSRDTIRDNNEASNYVYIQGDSRILFVTPDGAESEVEHLLEICREEKLGTEVIPPEKFPTSIEQLQRFDCIVLANISAGKFSQNQMTMIKAHVKDLGAGLIMLGGNNSFGAGGYEQTPIEEALPVSMDIQQKKIMPKGALVLILHTCEFAQGNFWAKKITNKAIETVNPQDDVGVVYYDYRSNESWLFTLQPALNKSWMYAKVDKCEPGDMPSFGPPFSMAKKALLSSDAMVKHVIVISDGDPARPAPKDIQAMAAGGITVSTICINPHSPRDKDVMKWIAYKTKGRYYDVQDPQTLPQIFVKEAKVVKRSLIFNKPFRPLLKMSSELTKGIRQQEVPKLMAYVATTPKDRALIAMVSDNDNHDPVLAQWRYGLGKSVAFTSDASSNWAKQWISWDKYKKIWTQVFRWTARKREKSNLEIRTRTDGDKVILTIDAIDNRGNYINFTKLDARRVDSRNEGHRLEIHQTGAGRYRAEFRARDIGVNLINIGYVTPAGKRGFTQTGISVPYSPEFLELNTNFALLQRVAEYGGQPEFLDSDPALANIFESNQPASISLRPVWEYLLIIAVLLFMADVIIRRVIITRADLAAVYDAVRGKFGKSAGEHDQTMSALLKRKEKVFTQKGKAKAKAKKAAQAQDFKAALEKQVKAGKGAGPVVEEELAETKPAEPAAPEPSKDKAEKPTKEETYTNRLLAAKRRAHKKDQEE